jgi:hypothetical protein
MKKVSMIVVSMLFIAGAAFVFSNASQLTDSSHTISLKHDIILEMTAGPFDSAKHRITECELMGSKGVCLIDDKPVFGTDWTLPRSQLMKAAVKMGSRVVHLDVSCMFNPWAEKPDPQDFSAEKVYGGYFVHGNFSDAAGSYKAEWFIVESGSARTQLSAVAH